MNTASFIAKNALRNKRRALLCILSVAVSLFLLVTLQIALREITVPPQDIAAAARIVVRNKISLGNFLPARQRTVIERMPAVQAVTPFTWFGGKYKNEENMTFAQFALDPTKLSEIFTEAKIAPEHLATFLKDPSACLVGWDTAERYHLKVGDRFTLKSTIFGVDLELKVAGFFYGTIDNRNVLFNHKYLDDATGNRNGWVGTWWIRARSLEEMPALLEQLNRAFANTSAEVRAETERAFQMSFVSMWGNIKILVRSICTVVVFTLILVSASTMSMAIRERFRELAILKAVGYRRRDLFAFILAESFGLAMLGAALGIGGAWFIYTHVSISRLTRGIFVVFEVTPRIIAQSFLVAVVLGIVASLAPSFSVARTSVVDGLKTLD